MVYKTEQEKFWASEFGNEYSERNEGKNLVACNTSLFEKVFKRTGKIGSIIEFGANRGLNLRGIRNLLPDAELSAVEINEFAKNKLNEWGGCKEILHQSALEFTPQRKYDLSMVKGVLIHINPSFLQKMYENLYDSSSRWILIAEYYNPTPVEVSYRGHSNRLFKRDFAGEVLDKYSDLTLVDYGFIYHRDPVFAQDDISWFLMEK